MFLFRDYVREEVARMVMEVTDREITTSVARETAKTLGLDFSKLEFSFEDFAEGIRVEMEHKDITGGDPIKTAKIALAHLRERPDYYTQLKKHVEN